MTREIVYDVIERRYEAEGRVETLVSSHAERATAESVAYINNLGVLGLMDLHDTPFYFVREQYV